MTRLIGYVDCFTTIEGGTADLTPGDTRTAWIRPPFPENGPVHALALRVLGRGRDEELRILDHVTAVVELGDPPRFWGKIPGSFLQEPGYVFPERFRSEAPFRVRVCAHPSCPAYAAVRVSAIFIALRETKIEGQPDVPLPVAIEKP